MLHVVYIFVDMALDRLCRLLDEQGGDLLGLVERLLEGGRELGADLADLLHKSVDSGELDCLQGLLQLVESLVKLGQRLLCLLREEVDIDGLGVCPH